MAEDSSTFIADEGGGESIKVMVRIRPDNRADIDENPTIVVDEEQNTLVVKTGDEKRNVTCSFDSVLSTRSDQLKVYSVCKYATDSVIKGFNSTIFAYGQTGSGKTFTMYGPPNNKGSRVGNAKVEGPEDLPETAGVVPRAIADIFRSIEANHVLQSSVCVSFLQCYNENLYDLLRDVLMSNPLSIRETGKEIFVQGLSEYRVESLSDTLQLLKIADKNRAVRETNMNDVSSRSHSIFQVIVNQRVEGDDGELSLKAKFNMVDLAGSERWDRVGVVEKDEGKVNEMNSINLSLHTLGRCISALAALAKKGGMKGGAGQKVTKDTGKHIPYRESKLTRLLQDSLGGNARTLIIATLSPSLINVEESLSTLKFADRARQVMSTVEVNQSRPVDYSVVVKLRRDLQGLRNQLREIAFQHYNKLPLEAMPPIDILNDANYKPTGIPSTDRAGSPRGSGMQMGPRPSLGGPLNAPRTTGGGRFNSLPGNASPRATVEKWKQLTGSKSGATSPRWGAGSPRAGPASPRAGQASPRGGPSKFTPAPPVSGTPGRPNPGMMSAAGGNDFANVMQEQLREAENEQLRLNQVALEKKNSLLWDLLVRVQDTTDKFFKYELEEERMHDCLAELYIIVGDVKAGKPVDSVTLPPPVVAMPAARVPVTNATVILAETQNLPALSKKSSAGEINSYSSQKGEVISSRMSVPRSTSRANNDRIPDQLTAAINQATVIAKLAEITDDDSKRLQLDNTTRSSSPRLDDKKFDAISPRRSVSPRLDDKKSGRTSMIPRLASGVPQTNDKPTSDGPETLPSTTGRLLIGRTPSNSFQPGSGSDAAPTSAGRPLSTTAQRTTRPLSTTAQRTTFPVAAPVANGRPLSIGRVQSGSFQATIGSASVPLANGRPLSIGRVPSNSFQTTNGPAAAPPAPPTQPPPVSKPSKTPVPILRLPTTASISGFDDDETNLEQLTEEERILHDLKRSQKKLKKQKQKAEYLQLKEEKALQLIKQQEELIKAQQLQQQQQQQYYQQQQSLHVTIDPKAKIIEEYEEDFND